MADVQKCIKLIPRAYQEEIFENARSANVIAALDTGSGKTFIAALLMKTIMALPASNGKKTIFLVPKVPLVDQQLEFLRAQTPLRVNGYKGAMRVDDWDRNRWLAEFASVDCLVMTAQIFKNVLTHGYWSLEQVALLIFDECHHARQHHPYNAIMTDHYQTCGITSRPRIFGMTASPVWNPKQPIDSIHRLQYNLSSKILAVRRHTDEINSHAHKPVELVLPYPKAPAAYVSYFSPTLWEHLEAEDLAGILNLDIQAWRLRYSSTLEAIGPAGADYYLLSNLNHALDSIFPIERFNIHIHGTQACDDIQLSLEQERQVNLGLKRLKDLVDVFSARLNGDMGYLSLEWLSPKLCTALELLCKHRSTSFQGVIFVDQRQIATTLSWALTRIAKARDWIRCAELTGHGNLSSEGESLRGMSLKAQKDVMESFRAGEFNLLIATSVAEEGLDFPACKLVIRYDSVHHMVGYVQSRGRARQRKSTYVLMIEENDTERRAKYEQFRNVEPSLSELYKTINAASIPISGGSPDPECEEDRYEQEDPRDLAEQETYVIPSTGAMLTYSSAISLLEHLCALIRRDKYMLSMQPKYTITDRYKASVVLPHALPLTGNQLIYDGPSKHSKKEAKRAVAFLAVRTLYQLGIFDDHLSPTKPRKGKFVEDADGMSIEEISETPVMMDVSVVSPWRYGPPWYLYTVLLDGCGSAGLVTGCILPEVRFSVQGIGMHLSGAFISISLDAEQVDMLEKFTRIGLFWCVTASPVTKILAGFLVPLDASGAIDWQMIQAVVTNENGTYNWDDVTEQDEGRMVFMNSKYCGNPMLFERFRHDLSLESSVTSAGIDCDYPTLRDYFDRKATTYYSKRLGSVITTLPPEGPILEASLLLRHPYAYYDILGSNLRDPLGTLLSRSSRKSILPRSHCRRLFLSYNVIRAFKFFASLCQCASDVYRTRECRRDLKLPEIREDLLIEALTLPCASAGFNNQRLETLGDSVLKLATTVYLYNHFPYKHEGQLTALKGCSVSNRLLLDRARRLRLEGYLISEGRASRTWQFALPSCDEGQVSDLEADYKLGVNTRFPRRSLQDCMEAILGASFLTGGVDLALKAGAALGLCFGGPTPWYERYSALENVPPAALFGKLQEDMGYTFRNGNLILEAVKHASFNSSDDSSDSACYQRLEFLGDAVVELVVTSYLYNRFPESKPGQLSWMRRGAICNSTLSALSVKKLSLHKYLLANNVELSKEVARQVVLLTETPYEEIVVDDWKFDPPKVLADLFESVMGAMFVDSGSNYPLVAPIIESLMEDALKLLHPDMPKDPVSGFMEWISKSGCTRAKFKKVPSNPDSQKRDSVAILVHDSIVGGPILVVNRQLARGLAAEEARLNLSNPDSDLSLTRVCTCRHMEAEGRDEEVPCDLPLRAVRERDIELETEEGFALVARLRAEESARDEMLAGTATDTQFPADPSLEDIERENEEIEEVEMMLQQTSPMSFTNELDMDCE